MDEALAGSRKVVPWLEESWSSQSVVCMVALENGVEDVAEGVVEDAVNMCVVVRWWFVVGP